MPKKKAALQIVELPPVLESGVETIGDTVSRQLAEYMAIWQERLRLRDWNLTLTLKKPDGDAVGELVDLVEDEKSATLLIGPDTTDEMERTVIHELLHLVFLGVEYNEQWDSIRHRAFEQSLNLTADALVRAYGPTRL